MCGRYSLLAEAGTVEERFGAAFADDFEARYNAAPSQSLPVVTGADPATLARMEWGFVPPWAEDRSEFGFINARAETLAEKPTFSGAFERTGQDGLRAGRCLVPADGFYEWVATEDGKQPFRVTLTDGEPFAMAGLWAEWRPAQTQTGLDAFSDPSGADSGTEVRSTYAIVTTEPNDLVADLHHRMAVVLPQDAERRWLTADAEEAADLLTPYPADRMRSYPVSRAVNDPANDSPAVVEPVET